MDEWTSMEYGWEYLEKNLSQCHFVIRNATCAGVESNPGLCGDRRATDLLNHGMVSDFGPGFCKERAP
jgi:hypothetical protein